MIFRIFMTVATVGLLAAMLLDQLRLRQMSPFKWSIWFALLAGLLVNIWAA